VRDARDLVVLAVGGAYLQVIATKERVKVSRAQLKLPTPLSAECAKRSVGLVAQVDVDRSEVEALASATTGHFIREPIWQNKKSVWLE